MTIGNTSSGSPHSIGSYASRSWSGTDYPTSSSGFNRPFKSGLYDLDGNLLDQRYASKEDIAAAVIRAKASRIKRGFNRRVPVPHPYSMNFVKGYQPPVSNEYGSGPYPFSYLFGGFGFESGWTANDDIVLLDKLRPAIQGSDFHLGVFIAEAPMAVKMIGNAATRLNGAISAARKGDFRKAQNVLLSGRNIQERFRNKTASNWLELQYGWLPLISDMESGAQFLAHKAYHSPITRVRVSRQVSNRITSNSPSLWGVSSDSWSYTRKSIIANIREVDQVQLSGLTDVASIAWERTPYSFVVDWAIPIGNYLSARNTVGSLQAEYITTTMIRSFARPDRDIILSGNSWYGCSSRWESWGSMTRSVSSSLDVPLPGFKPLDKIASWKHTANAVALLIQQKK